MDNVNALTRPGGVSGRIDYIDALKGFAALCVVLGHVFGGHLRNNEYPGANNVMFWIYNVIYSFHMPLYMMISGYVYAVAYYDEQGIPKKDRILRQEKNNVAVYVIFSVLFALFTACGHYIVNKEIYWPYLKDILIIWAKPISPYWYLYDLIILYPLFVCPLIRHTKYILLTGIFILAALLSSIVDVEWFNIQSLLYYSLFFYIGFSNKEHPTWIVGNRVVAVTSLCIALTLGIRFWDMAPFETLENMTMLSAVPIVKCFIALGISITLWNVFQKVRFLSGNRLLCYIGRYSLEIYVVHCFFTEGFRIILPRVIGSAYISVLVNFILSTFLTIAIAMVCKKLGIHGLFFKPVSYISEKKKAA